MKISSKPQACTVAQKDPDAMLGDDNTASVNWYVYMLRTGAGHLYTGISTDPLRRLQQHENGKAGARSLRGKGPLQLVWQQTAVDRSSASKVEAAIKKLAKTAKERLVAEASPFELN